MLLTHTAEISAKSRPQQSEDTDLVLESIGQAAIPPLDQGCRVGHCSSLAAVGRQEEFGCLGNDCC